MCNNFSDKVHYKVHDIVYIVCMVHVHIHVHIVMYILIMYTGVEKNNDDSKCHYFSSNKHDSPGEIIRSECQQEALRQSVRDHPTCARRMRSYYKRDDVKDYWKGSHEMFRRKRCNFTTLTSQALLAIFDILPSTSFFQSYHIYK